MTTRRSFLGSILAAGMAPAAIGSGILMPVKALAAPGFTVVRGWERFDGLLDDMEGFPKTATEIARRHEQVSRGIAYQMRAEQARENARFRRWLDDAQIVMDGKLQTREQLRGWVPEWRTA